MTAKNRFIFLLFLVLAPLGWFMFWAVFRAAPGQDWVVFPTAAALADAHDFATLADPRAFTDMLNRTHSAWFAKPISQLHPWVYPPVTLLLALAFGWMPYLVSLYAFLGATAAAMVAALWRWQNNLSERLTLVGFVLLCPATAYTIGAGQLSFLIAAIIVSAMSLLDKTPFAAGALFGLLCLKPQFGLMVPLALLAGRHFRAIAGAVSSAVLLVLLSLAIFGVRPWIDWIGFATGSSPWFARLLQQMRVYDQSMHATLHALGLGDSAAGLGQLMSTTISALCVWIAFGRGFKLRQRLIILLCAIVTGAPHVSGYDHLLLAIAILLILLDRREIGRGERALAGAVWLATMFNPPALIAVLGSPTLTWLSGLTGFLPFALMLVEMRPERRSRA